MTYATIIETLANEIPELTEDLDAKSFFADEDWKTDYLAYSFYGIFSRFLLAQLLREERDEVLLGRCFEYLERMATCEDVDVRTLLTVEVLETVFELPYTVYREVETSRMLPETRKLHEGNKPFFRQPEPPRAFDSLGGYRTRAEKKQAKKQAKNKHSQM